MNTIEHIIEPTKLLVCWQAPEGNNRKRFIIGELEKMQDSSIVFRYKINSEDLNEAKKMGFVGYPAFSIKEEEHTEGVMETFARRLPPKSRGDFNKYLELYRLPKDKDISDFSLLAYSGAKLPTDGFSIINPFYNLNEPCEFLMEVAGSRYAKSFDISKLDIGDQVSIKKDEANSFDCQAIAIEYREERIGYINRGLVKTFHHWIDSNAKIYLTIERVNGHPVRPLVFLFVKVKPKKV